MNRFARGWWWRATAVTLAIGAGALAHACNVPVFRFALERWRPDPYRVVVFHRGEWSDAEREMLQPLDDQQDKGLANVAVQCVDLADEKNAASDALAADRSLYESLGKPTLPWVVIQYPEHLGLAKPAWAGPLSREVVASITDSPIRRELARRLADGQTAVWLLLESGQAEKDDPVLALLEKELKSLEQTLELPELTSSPDDALTVSLPLKVAFSVLRVPRNVAQEHALVAILIGSEPDLAERSDPMVFPVFGRGRALLPLIGAGITPQNIQEAAGFLAGPCSCEVKEQNPGFDLLVGTDWDVLLTENGVSLTAVETRSVSPTNEPVLVPIPKGSKPQESGPPAAAAVSNSPVPIGAAQRQPLLIAGIAGASVLAVILLIAVAFATTRS